MEFFRRTRNYAHTPTGILDKEEEIGFSSADSIVAGFMALAIAGGVIFSSYDLDRLQAQFKALEKVEIAASAPARTSPVRRRVDFNVLAAQSRDLFAVADRATFDEREVTGEDILALVDQYGGNAIVERDPESGVIDSITASFTDYEPDEMLEVLESLQATGTPPAPQMLVGDLAQTSITNVSGQEQILSLAEWQISWKRKMVDATTTDNALYESSLGSSKSWTAKAKYMFVDGDQTQVDGVLSAINTNALAALTWNFFPTVALGRQAFSGLAFVDGIDIGAGSGKIVGLDVSLKGTGPLNLKTQTAPIVNANTVTGLSAQV